MDFKIDFKSIYILAKKELMDNIRNKWVIILTIIFTALTLLASYAGSMYSTGWQDLTATIGTMNLFAQYLISVIALILGYSTIIGEIESGSMNSLLSLPIKRYEVLLGKLLGLGSILAISILIGFGFAGIIIGFNVENVNFSEYFIFILASILMGLIFLSIGILISTTLKRRTSAMGTAIFVWFLFAIIWLFIVTAIIIASNAQLLDVNNQGSTPNVEITLPEVYYISEFCNPLSSYSEFINQNIGAIDSSEYSQYITPPPGYINSNSMLISMIIWFIAPLGLAFWRFEKREI